jgi:GNAT superfamily N-acetyltransferase
LRKLYLQQMNMQIRYDAVHERGWSDAYLIKAGTDPIGYGSIKGKDDLSLRDAIFECYMIPAYQKNARDVFAALLSTCDAKYIECQSNDLLLSQLLYEFSDQISSDTILFGDHVVTHWDLPGFSFRKREAADKIFEHFSEPDGPFVVDKNGEVLATGGFLLHYNFPFADLYMEVREDSRRMGIGSFLIQELKRVCYGSGRVPAARCGIQNKASKATLIRAGLKISGYMQTGQIVSGR